MTLPWPGILVRQELLSLALPVHTTHDINLARQPIGTVYAPKPKPGISKRLGSFRRLPSADFMGE